MWLIQDSNLMCAEKILHFSLHRYLGMATFTGFTAPLLYKLKMNVDRHGLEPWTFIISLLL